MIYGHELDNGWSTRTLIGSIALGVATGAALGLLFAPAKGMQARRSLGDAATRLRSRLEVARRSATRTSLPGSEPEAIVTSRIETV